jgi:hypothetical protein
MSGRTREVIENNEEMTFSGPKVFLETMALMLFIEGNGYKRKILFKRKSTIEHLF